jgi:hypothetical protein
MLTAYAAPPSNIGVKFNFSICHFFVLCKCVVEPGWFCRSALGAIKFTRLRPFAGLNCLSVGMECGPERWCWLGIRRVWRLGSVEGPGLAFLDELLDISESAIGDYVEEWKELICFARSVVGIKKNRPNE